jgi:hypothetical protein
LGFGVDLQRGGLVRGRVVHRFSPHLFGGVEGRATYGPRRGVEGSLIGVLGGVW